MRRFPISLLLIICGLILLGGLLPYFIRFHYGLDDKQGTFGTFGDYLNPFLSLINIVLLSYISFRANQISQAFNQVQLQPQLFLGMESSQTIANDEDWVIRNGFEAPAINILVRITLDRNSNNFTRWVNCFSLAKDLKKELVWIRGADEIQVIWSDISGQRFYRITYRDWNGILDTNLTEAVYTEAFQNARSHNLNTNELISRDFTNYFYGAMPIAFSATSYEAYLQQRGLL
jgi:hypothetical protein